jgi:hypothetical protein
METMKECLIYLQMKVDAYDNEIDGEFEIIERTDEEKVRPF